MKSSQEIFDAGYAIEVYDPRPTHRVWVFRNERFTTPMDVKTVMLDGVPFPVLPKEQVDEFAALPRAGG